MIKVIVAIIVTVAAMIGIIAWLGTYLPVGHVASRSAVIGAPIDVVFATITDFANAGSWRPDLRSVAVATDSATRRTRVTESVSTDEITMEVEQLVPPSRLVMRIVGEDMPFGGAWAYALDPQGDATRVTITEHGEVYNPVFRFIARYIMGHTRTLDTYLVNLGRKFGTEVTPVDAMPVPLRVTGDG